MEDSQMKIREAKEESQIKESAKQIRDKKQDIKFDVRDYPINYLVSQYEKQEFYIPLEYQRNFVWGNKDRCFFIESILMGLPIPFMFFADTDDGRIEIVDGAQRTQTLVQFCQNDLELQDLQILENSNGFLFEDLDPAIQRKFLNTNVRVVFLEEGTTENVRQEIFKRINTSGSPIKPAEARRGSFEGKFKVFLEECVKNPLFNELAPRTKITEDRYEGFELVSRFFAYYDNYDADFENYTIDDSVLTYGGGSPKLTVAKDNENSYLSYASTGSTVGVWQKLDTIDCTNKTVTVNADIKFAPKGTAGNSQFSIGDTSPKFDSNNVNYGFVNKSKKYDGHIIAVEYNSGSTLLVNGQTVSNDFVGSWIHLNAEINFATKKINVTLKNDNDITAELNDLDFYSSNDITEIGSFYFRAAKSNGTVGLDNLTMVCE